MVLTSDRAFIARRYCEAAYFVRGPDKRSQLAEVTPQCCCHCSLHCCHPLRCWAHILASRASSAPIRPEYGATHRC